MKDVLIALLTSTGSLFMFLAAIGLLRLPDVFSRIHAATLGATFGIVAIFSAVALHFGDLANVAEAALVVALVFLTAPVGSHIIARAAYRVGVPLWEGTVCDDLRETLDLENEGDRVTGRDENDDPTQTTG